MTNMADCEPLIPVDMNQDYRTTMYTKLRTFRDPSQSREPSSDEVSFYSYSYDYQSRSIDDSLEHKKCCSFKTRCPGITIEPIVFIYILCLGIIRYAAQDYLVLSIRKDSNATLSDNSTASEYDLFISQFHGVDMVYVIRIIGLYLPGIIIAFFIGAVSDKYGRRLVLFFPSVGILLHSLITLVVVWGRLPSWLLLFAAILDGCFGGPCIMTTGLYGYLSHITIKEHRSIRFYVIAVMAWAATYISQFIENYNEGFYARFYILLGVTIALIINLFLVQYFIKEPARMHPDRDILDCDNLMMTVRVFREHTTVGSVWKLRALILVVLLLSSSVDEPEGLYLLALRSQYNDWMTLKYSDIEVYLTAMLLVVSLIPLCLLWLTTKKVSDYVYIIAGLLSAFCVKIWQMLPIENSSVVALVYACLGFMTSVPIPLIRSALSKVARQRDQGAVAAGVSIAQQSGLIVASFVMTLNYMTSTLIVGTALIVLALAIAGYVYWRARCDYKQRETDSGLMMGLRGYTPIL